MYLFGIGFPPEEWESLLQQLEASLEGPPLGGIRLSIDTPEGFRQALRLAESTPPQAILIRPGAFEDAEVLLEFLEAAQAFTDALTRIAIVIQDVAEEMPYLLPEGTTLRLSNGMQVRPLDPEGILPQSIRSFPRIKIDGQAMLRFINPDGRKLECAVEDFPEGTLLPWRRVMQIRTEFGWEDPRLWLTQVLSELEASVLPEQVQGILREENGGYLFPGVPYPSLLSLEGPRLRVDHCLRAEALTPRNAAFRRLVQSLKALIPASAQVAPVNRSIRCLGTPSVLNEVMRQVLQQNGVHQFTALSQLAPGRYTLEPELTCLQLSTFPEVALKGDLRDCVPAVNQALSPLNGWVALEDLGVTSTLPERPLTAEEFQARRHQLQHHSRSNQQVLQLAQNRITLFEQERDALLAARDIAEVLLELEVDCLDWEESLHRFDLKSQYVLMLCDDEDMAMDLHGSLLEVPRKLWINTDELKEPEHLRRFDVRSLSDPDLQPQLIATEEARTQLVDLCHRATEAAAQADQTLLEQHDTIARAESEYYLLAFLSQELALHHLAEHFREIIRKEFPALGDTAVEDSDSST